MRKMTGLFALVLLATATSAFAQVGSKPLVGHFAFGWVDPQGKAGDAAESGWNFSGGATVFKDPHKPIGIRGDFAYNWFYATEGAVESANGSGAISQIDDGFASMTTITVDAIYDFSRPGKVGGYFGLGLGMYSRYWQLTQTALVGGIWCDPWTGWCYPGTVAGQVIADSDRLTKIGYNAVAAITFPLKSGAQIYLEASYQYMDSSPATEYVPILFGMRW